WVSPVLAPVLCSLLMIAMALLLDFRMTNNNLKKLKINEFIYMLSGATVIYYTFTVDFGMMIIKGHFLQKYFTLAENREFLEILTSWEPIHFNWLIFALGIGLICVGIYLVNRRSIATS
ncbi:MAG: hypothetical protein Q7U86_07730, partial [Draconibacterium sp.]|nr:hypothetical protein [Draconibacterium sp.]